MRWRSRDGVMDGRVLETLGEKDLEGNVWCCKVVGNLKGLTEAEEIRGWRRVLKTNFVADC
jgi:hypothetical protein